jgi:hypothetical protein
VELHVHQADLERAQKILAEFNEGKSLQKSDKGL